jgi:two-component system sensor histidine kinase YesM
VKRRFDLVKRIGKPFEFDLLYNFQIHMRLPFFITVFISLLLLPIETTAQDSIQPQVKQSKSKRVNTQAQKLEYSLKKNDEGAIAKSYENLAQGFLDKGDNAKAEEYFKKALTVYTKTKSNDDIARVTRSLAKVQESQNKFSSAALNYKKADEVSDDASWSRANSLDYKRLQNAESPKVQEQLVDSKIDALDKNRQKDEVVDAYVQKAAINLRNDDTKAAIKSFEMALPFANAKPEKVAEIKNEIAKAYVANSEYDTAIGLTQDVLSKAEVSNDYDSQIGQWRNLSDIYFKKGDTQKAVAALRKAYDLSFQNGRTAEAKKSLSQLLDYYRSRGDDKSSIALYDEFFRNFDKLIESDSTLIDAKTFQVTEEKIRQLENEKKLKDELISRKNLFNMVLLGSILLLLLLFAFIIRALRAIKIKNKEIALQSLRREMNPHFIFNSLNSVNQFISQNNEREANKYLSSYSTLMRNMMENSNRDFITLGNEIEQLRKYLELEHMRFRDQFDYEISVDENLDTETTFIPNMIVQPHLENAIWHGLRYKESKGLLLLKIILRDNKVVIMVNDDGIGLTKSRELKTKNQMVHQSRGITNTKERMALLNDLYKKEIALTVIEKAAPLTGTIVEITFPLIDKIQ